MNNLIKISLVGVAGLLVSGCSSNPKAQSPKEMPEVAVQRAPAVQPASESEVQSRSPEVDEFGIPVETLRECQGTKKQVAKTAVLVAWHLDKLLHKLANDPYYQARFIREYNTYKSVHRAERTNLTVREDLINFLDRFEGAK